MPRPWSRSTPEGTDAGHSGTDNSGTDELSDILDHMSEGVVVLGPDLRPLIGNLSARRLLGMSTTSLPRRLPSEEIVSVAASARDDASAHEATVKLFFPAATTLQVRAAPLDGGRTLLTLRDMTQEVMAQRVRKEFVSHASHELKSPVASMQALAEAVHKALEDDPDAAARFSEKLVGESERLGRLVNDLLDLSRLEDPAASPTEAIDLSLLAGREIDEIRDAATQKQIELTCSVGENVWVRGDEQQLGLLIRNLLENAVRYTSDAGHVHIDVSLGDTDVTITVSDDGIGIPREAQGRVFERFYRVDRARSRERGGTGLGLAIVKHVAELHGGSVELESELGQGSKFVARFPRLPTEGHVRSIAG